MKKFFLTALACLMVHLTWSEQPARQMEQLDRGLVAVKQNYNVFLSWRMLGTDPDEIGFNIYRDGVKINSTPLFDKTNTFDVHGTLQSVYHVLPVLDGVEDTTGVTYVKPWSSSVLTLQLQRPQGGITEPNRTGSVGKTPDATYSTGQAYSYIPNDCSVGDLDGDGQYELLVKWDPTNSQDNSYYGITGKVYLDAYKLDGTFLWRIDLGKNIRAGAHYTQFMVADFDGDGYAELVCKTAPGTVDGTGKYVLMGSDQPTADYRSLDVTQDRGSRMLGTIQTGSEYLTLFDGRTGAELHSTAYKPARGSVSNWGDSYANRSDRFLACVAYLDGVKPSVVMGRGYYARTTLVAYDVIDKKLSERWFYDSGTTAGFGAFGQGNHNLSVGDVDDDGKDEIVYGSCAFDDDGSLLYSTRLGHGDAMHLSDMDPDRPGLEAWVVHEDKNVSYGYELHDAQTGTVLWGAKTGTDVGRGMAADIDGNNPGFEMWSTGSSGTYSTKGVQVSSKRPSVNFRIYWDGDLRDELLDGTVISKWNGNGTTNLLNPSNVGSCNSTKKTPNLSADIFGDWREELVLWSTTDPSQLKIFTTVISSPYRLFTLMHDPVYRNAIAWQNVAYNQPPHLGFYMGDGLEKVEKPNIVLVQPDLAASVEIPSKVSFVSAYLSQRVLRIQTSEALARLEVFNTQGVLLYQTNQPIDRIYEVTLPDYNSLLLVRACDVHGNWSVVKVVSQ